MLSNLSSIVNNRGSTIIDPLTKPTNAVLRYTFYTSSTTTVPNMWIGGTTYNATLTGTGMTTSNTVYPPNGVNNIYSLVCPENISGSTKYLAIPSGITLSNRFIFSVSLWMYILQNTSGGDCIAWELDKNGGCFMYQHQTTKKWYVNLIGTSIFDMTLLQWHHIVICYNYTAGVLTYSLYLDGVNLQLNTTGLVATNGPASNVLGAGRLARSVSSAHHSFKGYIGDFRIYNGTLTADEVLSIYNGNNI